MYYTNICVITPSSHHIRGLSRFFVKRRFCGKSRLSLSFPFKNECLRLNDPMTNKPIESTTLRCKFP